MESVDRQAVFKASVRLLATSSLSLIEDYPHANSTSYKLLTHYVSKTQLGRLRSDIRRATRYLIAINDVPQLNEVRDWVKKLDKWHKQIARNHIPHQNIQWMYYATAFHYMIDAYLHIFKRFLVNPTMRGHNCHWCKAPLVVSWGKLVESLVKDFVPNIYLYTSLAQAQNTDVDLCKIPEQSLEELRELGRAALIS